MLYKEVSFAPPIQHTTFSNCKSDHEPGQKRLWWLPHFCPCFVGTMSCWNFMSPYTIITQNRYIMRLWYSTRSRLRLLFPLLLNHSIFFNWLWEKVTEKNLVNYTFVSLCLFSSNRRSGSSISTEQETGHVVVVEEKKVKWNVKKWVI